MHCNMETILRVYEAQCNEQSTIQLPVNYPNADRFLKKHFSCKFVMKYFGPSVLRHCWLGDRKGIRPVKN